MNQQERCKHRQALGLQEVSPKPIHLKSKNEGRPEHGTGPLLPISNVDGEQGASSKNHYRRAQAEGRDDQVFLR